MSKVYILYTSRPYHAFFQQSHCLHAHPLGAAALLINWPDGGCPASGVRRAPGDSLHRFKFQHYYLHMNHMQYHVVIIAPTVDM